MTEKTTPKDQLNIYSQKHNVLLTVVLALTTLAVIVNLITFTLTGKIPSHFNDAEFPDWWIYVFPIKEVILLCSIILTWTWRKIGIFGLLLIILLNLFTTIVFETDIMKGFAIIIAIGVILTTVKGEWSKYR